MSSNVSQYQTLPEAERIMDETYDRYEPMLRVSDAVSPETVAEELARQGILASADDVRQIAIELGACRKLGEALFLLPEDVDAILRHGKQKPRSSATEPASTAPEPSARTSKEPKKLIQPDQNVRAEVYTPPMLAKRWRCSDRHIRNMINEGKLGCFRLGGKLVRIRHSDVEAAEKAFAEEALLPGEPSPSPRDSANEVMTRARVNALRAKRLDR
jgi:excisionase family DNA binding protein